MWRALLTFVLLLFVLAHPEYKSIDWDPEIPVAAQMTIYQDYMEWMHPPKRGGDCEQMPVLRVTWMRPPAVDEQQPVLWVKTPEKIGAILGLSYTDLRYLERSIWAQPVMVLRDVVILRPCRPPSDLASAEE